MSLAAGDLDVRPLDGEVVSLVEATSTFDCKEPNCNRDALTTRGRYANLCEFHKRRRIEEDRADRATAPAKLTQREVPVEDRHGRGALVEAAKGLVAEAKALERAADRRFAAQRALARRDAEYRQASSRFRDSFVKVRDEALRTKASLGE
jgi:hypothetical protein